MPRLGSLQGSASTMSWDERGAYTEQVDTPPGGRRCKQAEASQCLHQNQSGCKHAPASFHAMAAPAGSVPGQATGDWAAGSPTSRAAQALLPAPAQPHLCGCRRPPPMPGGHLLPRGLIARQCTPLQAHLTATGAPQQAFPQSATCPQAAPSWPQTGHACITPQPSSTPSQLPAVPGGHRLARPRAPHSCGTCSARCPAHLSGCRRPPAQCLPPHAPAAWPGAGRQPH